MAEWLVLAPRNGGSRFSTLALLGRAEVNSVSLAPEAGRLTLRLDPLHRIEGGATDGRRPGTPRPRAGRPRLPGPRQRPVVPRDLSCPHPRGPDGRAPQPGLH